MTNQQSNPDGTLHEDELRWLESRVRGGFAAVVTCASHVSPEGQGWPGQLGVWDDAFLPGLTRVASTLRSNGGVALMQLHHGGERARPDLSGLARVAPWTDRETGSVALSTGEVERIIEDHVAAAERAERAGFDGVEIHGAHGFLVSQFLSQQNVARRDHFGGSLTNRSRFLCEVISGIRENVGAQFQIGVRLGPELRGTDLREAREVVAVVMGSGEVDFVDLSMRDNFKHPEEPEFAGRPLLDYFTEIPRNGVRLGAAGKVLSAGDAARCLEMGLDFVLVGKAGVLHHDFAAQVLADHHFAAMPTPVTRAHLRGESLSETFIDYLAEVWTEFVA